MDIAWRQVFIAFMAGIIIQSSGLHNQELSKVLGDNQTNGNFTKTLEINQTVDFGIEPLDEEKVEELVHQKINEERTQRGLSKLDYSEKLENIADKHSKDMAENNYFAHTSPSGQTMADRYEQANYICSIDTGAVIQQGAENIAQTWYQEPISTESGTVLHESEEDVAEGLVTQWMNSPGHRKNILKPYWNNEGIGIYVTEDDEVFATQNFC